MIDISTLSKDELIALRSRVNGRIASLTFQEKRKEDPKRYSCRNMDLYFKKSNYKLMILIEHDYKDYIKVRYDGVLYDFGSNGALCVIRLWAPTEIRKEILEKYENKRIYQVYTPESKVLYPGYVILGKNKKEEQND